MSLFWGCFEKLDADERWVADLATVDFYCSKPSQNLQLWARGQASCGMVSLQWHPGKPEGMPGPFWGGWVFDKERPWQGFEKELWHLPKQLVWQGEGGCFACGFGQSLEEAQRCLYQLVREQKQRLQVPCALPPSAHRLGDLRQERQSWESLVKAALQKVNEGNTHKLVLARQIHVASELGWAPSRILNKLESRFEDCWIYFIRGGGGHFFIGATPEVLCQIQGRQLETEALAGTASVGEETELLHSEKDLREHRWVIEGMHRALQPLSEAIEIAPSVGIRTLPNLIHLCTPIRASLRKGVLPLEVARAMHPSPAVAGTPKEEAMVFLREREPFPRGWYAGVLGFGNAEDLTLFVTLRSAKIGSKVAEIFVGAGVVQGSLEESEWLETERKAQALLHALDVL
ncbi:MAG: isochorismate synthase [Cystobacterineae bacterium]|nr:isochorismate synthase [Cystobacterineae bacterium]